jgi:hypothetical protein
MSREETKQVVEAFVETNAGCWLAEAVQLTRPTRVVASGRDEVREVLAQLHSSDAVDGRTTQTRVVVGDGIAAVEIRPLPGDGDAHATETPDRHGLRSAACFYEVSGGEIVRASVHIDSTTTPPQRVTRPTNEHTERRI